MKKLYVYFQDEFKLVDSERLDFNYPHTPLNRVRFNCRKLSSGECKWTYVAYGETKNECANRHNCHEIVKIENLKAEIKRLESLLVKPTGV